MGSKNIFKPKIIIEDYRIWGTNYWLEKEILDSRFFDNLDKFTNSKPPLWTAGVRQRACDAFLCKLLSRQLA